MPNSTTKAGASMLALWIACSVAHARADGRYAQAENRDWYLSAELTEAAQKRFGFKSCCAHSDVVRTKFRGGSADGWDYWDGSKWVPVPADIIHNDPAPGGEPITFAVGGQPTCFFPPLGGL